jgi:NADH-quinone oxidoreductase subunit L
MAVIILLVLLMAWTAYRKFVKSPGPEEKAVGRTAFFHRLLTNKFYVDEIYDTIVVKPALRISEILHKFVEIRFIDRIVDGTGTMVVRFSNVIRYLQAGHVGAYLFFMIIGILLILFFNIIL